MYIIWTDTATWKRNPCKSREGELALDIVLKKIVVKHNGDADDRMVLIHMASFGTNSMVKDYSLRLKVAEFYRSGSHQEVCSMSHPGLPEFHQLPHSQSHHSHSHHWPSSSMHSILPIIHNRDPSHCITSIFVFHAHCQYHTHHLPMTLTLLPFQPTHHHANSFTSHQITILFLTTPPVLSHTHAY